MLCRVETSTAHKWQENGCKGKINAIKLLAYAPNSYYSSHYTTLWIHGDYHYDDVVTTLQSPRQTTGRWLHHTHTDANKYLLPWGRCGNLATRHLVGNCPTTTWAPARYTVICSHTQLLCRYQGGTDTWFKKPNALLTYRAESCLLCTCSSDNKTAFSRWGDSSVMATQKRPRSKALQEKKIHKILIRWLSL